ncbi:MAG TPA: hypothetical protein VGK97_05985 [Spongiibacteraceae bacterium]|jgi:hypothetical protein
MSLFFDDEFAEKILAMPEYRQGANRIKVTLNDGRVFRGVFVAWGREVIRVEGLTSIPFEVEDVSSIENDLG